MGKASFLLRDKLYVTYSMMKQRCNNKKHIAYPRYGGKGIKCEWVSFMDFKNDMYDSFQEHLEKYGKKNTTIDRINNDGNYCKGNCRWATRKEQQNNTKKSIKKEIREIMAHYAREIRYRCGKRYIYYNGKWDTLTGWIVYLSMDISRVTSRISVCGRSREEALGFKKRITIYKNKGIKKIKNKK